MHYWLMKSEPDVYAWSKLAADGVGHWDGVRNHQAAANLRAMKVGDRAFFYHSNIGKEIVGTMEIVKAWHPDPTDDTGKWGMVDVKPLHAAKASVTLAQIRTDAALAGMALLRQSHLSVQPVGAAEWKRICKLAGVPG